MKQQVSEVADAEWTVTAWAALVTVVTPIM